MPAITTSLWFDDNLEEAAAFHASVFPNSRIETMVAPDGGPAFAFT